MTLQGDHKEVCFTRESKGKVTLEFTVQTVRVKGAAGHNDIGQTGLAQMTWRYGYAIKGVGFFRRTEPLKFCPVAPRKLGSTPYRVP